MCNIKIYEKKISCAILCAGFSTRINSYKSKILHNIIEETIFFRIIKKIIKFNIFNKIIIVLGNDYNIIKNYIINKFNFKFKFIKQKNIDGTFGAILYVINYLEKEEKLLIINSDIPFLKINLIKKLVKKSCNICIVTSYVNKYLAKYLGYGIIIRDKFNKIIDICESKNYFNNNINTIKNKCFKVINKKKIEINVGIYLFDVKFLIYYFNYNNLYSNIFTKVFKFFNNLNIKINKTIKKDKKFCEFRNIIVSNFESMSINNRISLYMCESMLRFKIIKKWIKNGVNFINYKNVYIGNDVKICKDVIIHGNVEIKGKTIIGSKTEILSGSLIDNSFICSNVKILRNTIIKYSFIGRGSSIGPFSVLRYNNFVGKFNSIGNFVEVKNSIFGNFCKINHKSYLGDIIIGNNCNIGAGVIFCNFNGKNKFKSFISDFNFIGSNSIIISPVFIGKFCFISSLSIIKINLNNCVFFNINVNKFNILTNNF